MSLLGRIYPLLQRNDAVLLMQALSAVWSFPELHGFGFDLELGRYKYARSKQKNIDSKIVELPTVSPEPKRSVNIYFLFINYKYNKIHDICQGSLLKRFQ